MPNISIINKCNLECDYCFAKDMTNNPNFYQISFEEYKKLFQFIINSQSYKHIGIIGGEPTLHPNLKDILIYTNNQCKLNNATALLFTNGINLLPFIPYIENNISVLININSPNTMSEDQWKNLNKTLDYIFSPNDPVEFECTCGCNIHLNCDDYNYIWEIIDKYKIQNLRCSIASPGGCYQNWIQKKQQYYNTLKPIFLQFCLDAKKHNCKLNLDCNKIPLCYFTSDELNLVASVCINYEKLFCKPVIDFISSNEAVSCFGNYKPINITSFQTFDDLYNFFYTQNNDLRNNLIINSSCKQCNLFQTNQCQSSCLSFI